MPALRAIAVLALLLGTVLLVAGIVRDRLDVALLGVAIWTVSVVLGLLMQRLEPR